MKPAPTCAAIRRRLPVQASAAAGPWAVSAYHHCTLVLPVHQCKDCGVLWRSCRHRSAKGHLQDSSAACHCIAGPWTICMRYCLHTTLLGAPAPLVKQIAGTLSKAHTYRIRPLGLVCGLHPSHIQAMLWRLFYHLLSANKGREVQVISNNLQPLPWVRLSAVCAAGTSPVKRMTIIGTPIID